MKITQYIESAFKKLIPAPFTLAVLLSILTILIAMLFTNSSRGNHVVEILQYWQEGMWEPSLLVFAVQMMLILVLGHVLVLSRPVAWLTGKLTNLVTGNSSAVILVSVSTMLVAFFNWGLGLIFGAIMARKVGEAARDRGFNINYPLIGAAGYVGLMVWHGGISGSAPLKVAENGHIASLFTQSSDDPIISNLPSFISTDTTIFASWNLIIFGILLVAIPLALWIIGKRTASTSINLPVEKKIEKSKLIEGAEKIDNSRLLKIIFGSLLLAAFFASYYKELLSAKLTPNMLNFFMLAICILLHRSFVSFLSALEESITGAAAILIQFPLYFGIMGIMKETGLVGDIAGFFTNIATDNTLPVFTFFSAGIVNIFVPSGGGQWAIQGPIVLESAIKLGIPLNKAVMAFAYGDQITNMLQPFWALPLLAITKLKAREILPYTLIMMVVGAFIYIGGLLLI
ncbi:short-chain fatty acid transporter [Christiangramia echinicola]|uniref:Short-chain fatty acids transporter n=1 Tax=Christiangramia echinicola TaxID=279359 RepID=A0A1H1KYL0_9FLAO|nr:TIGR00366 family protein [Christiangramia echinicola]SDR67414.1 short-chain fatty acids transporter [Christiangramia echinicola]